MVVPWFTGNIGAVVLNDCVLLQIFDGNDVPQRMVDGWNAFFFDDLDELVRMQ